MPVSALPTSVRSMTSTPLRDRMAAALPDAIRDRDQLAVRALRSALATLANAEAVGIGVPGPAAADSTHVAAATTGVGTADVARRVLAEHEVVALVRAEVDERLEGRPSTTVPGSPPGRHACAVSQP